MKLSNIAATALAYLIFITLLTGLLYPLAVTLSAKFIFPEQADGSLIIGKDGCNGSFLIGQDFKEDKFFHGRPSCSSYDPMGSGASNLSVISASLKTETDRRRDEWHKKYNVNSMPEEMLYASGSGLDPEISMEAALAQAGRVSKARGYNEMQKKQLKEYIKAKAVSTAISHSVNVVKLNLMLGNAGIPKIADRN